MKTSIATRALLAAILAAVLWQENCPGAEEREWEGKTLTQWIKLAGDGDPEFREKAAIALGYFGPDGEKAVPVLIKLLDLIKVLNTYCLSHKQYYEIILGFAYFRTKT